MHQRYCDSQLGNQNLAFTLIFNLFQPCVHYIRHLYIVWLVPKQGDQASIIGGAINFVKELEQLLQCMKGRNIKTKEQQQQGHEDGSSSSPFAEFFMFPQYSTRATSEGSKCYPNTCCEPTVAQNQNQPPAAADIEVTLVDGHANIKILSKKQPGQLVKMVVGMQSLGFIILHLNVTTVEDMVLASVSVKVQPCLHFCQFLLRFFFVVFLCFFTGLNMFLSLHDNELLGLITQKKIL